jgi:hypothetical protein
MISSRKTQSRYTNITDDDDDNYDYDKNIEE